MKHPVFTYLCLIVALLYSTKVFAESHDMKVNAVYTVEFGGFKLGKFRFQSSISEDTYSMNGSTRLKILGGSVMDWKMKMNSGGVMTQAGMQPEIFSYSFRNKKKKAKSLKLSFAQPPQTAMMVVPEPRKTKKHIPLKPEHFKDVVDPMSALMVLTYAKGQPMNRKICSRTIRLFDGKERYNIALKYKKVKMATIGRKQTRKAKAYVCSLRYVPIAGHKRKDKTKKYMSNVKGIEVWFTPMKEAGIYVPHTIKIPTPFGTNTTIRARYFGVQQNGGQQVHFIK